ncbi:MAG: ribonuclease [Sphingomonadales bacterium]|nr:ribonuclease [Sphingomonadales bacterium]MDE2567657.1 ribonuclease [Sphingomonadales bacterium]
MAEWLVEEGIGETRAILVERGAIRAARIAWDTPLRAGLVAAAQVVSRRKGTKRGTVRFDDGGEALADMLPPESTEGSSVTVLVTRAAISERGRTKLPQARPAPGEAPRPAPSLAETLEGAKVIRVNAHDGRFDDAGWTELVEEALRGEIAFPGGSLTVSPTPAMTLIDIDGDEAPRALALAAVPAIASALLRLDLGGSVGIDFPTLPEKKDRQAVDSALADTLGDWRGERTAMNGFGFVQLVSRLERPSLVHLYSRKPSAAARILLRRAERVSEPGALLLTAHPAVRRQVRAEWEAELSRRTGRGIVWREEAGLALTAAFAQAIVP